LHDALPIFEVDAERSPGFSWSGFMPKHIEQPAVRHSAPKSVKILSRPSFSACFFTTSEDGTTIMRVSAAIVRPSTTSAAARRSRSEEHTSELQSRFDLVCRLLLEKKKTTARTNYS